MWAPLNPTQGHMASDCPEPEVCRRCRKEGHIKVLFLLLFVEFERELNLKDDCPEPEKCFNCRQEGHSSADCPEPELCRKCRKPVSEILFLSMQACEEACRPSLFLNKTVPPRVMSGTTAPSQTSAITAERRDIRLPTVLSQPSAGGAGKKVTRLPTVLNQCAAASLARRVT